jgi:hypothetical protein
MNFRDVKKKLSLMGFHKKRNGKGTHQIWEGEVNGIRKCIPICFSKYMRNINEDTFLKIIKQETQTESIKRRGV